MLSIVDDYKKTANKKPKAQIECTQYNINIKKGNKKSKQTKYSV